MPEEDEIIGVEEKPVETKSLWQRIKQSVAAKVSAVFTIIGTGVLIFVNVGDKEITVCVGHPNFKDTVCVCITDTNSTKDSARVFFLIDSLNKESERLYCTDKKDYSKISYQNNAGVLSAITGYAAVKINDSTTIQQPILSTLNTERSTDSTDIIFYRENAYYVIAKKDMEYHGIFDGNFARAFRIDFILHNGKRKADAIIDYKSNAYFVKLEKGDTLDPGYSTVPLFVGASFQADTSFYPIDTIGLVHHYPLNSDTASATTYDSVGFNPVNGTFIGGAFDSIGMKLGTGCVIFPDGAGGDNRICIPDMTAFDGAASWTIGFWLWINDTLTAGSRVLMDARKSTTTLFGLNLPTFSVTKKIRFLMYESPNADTVYTPAIPFLTFYKKWTHVCITKKDTTALAGDAFCIFVNGIKQNLIYGVAGGYNNAVLNADTIFIGNFQGATAPAIFSRMDNFKIFNKTLSSQQVVTSFLNTKEKWTGYDSTSTGQAYVDTQANTYPAGSSARQVDSVAFINLATNDSAHFAVSANNRYSLFGTVIKLLLTDSTCSDSAKDTVVITQGKQIKYRHDIAISKFCTLSVGSINNVGYCITFSRRKVQVAKTINDEYYAYDTLWIPIIDSIRPISGVIAGGTTVTIKGNYFKATQGSGTITFGGTAAASYTSWADAQVVAVTPAYAAGVVNCILTNSDAKKDTVTFEYITGTIVIGTRGGYSGGWSGGYSGGY